MVRLYLKHLLAFVIWAFLVFGLAYLIWPGMFDEGFPLPIFLAVLLFSWLTPATRHVLATRWIKGPERWRVRQRIEVLVDMPLPAALERCAAALSRIPAVKRVRHRGEGTIEARTRTKDSGHLDFRLGDRISCRVTAVDDRHARVIISSRPAWPLATTDDGRNWKHVVAIRDALVSGPPTSRRRSREGPGPRARSHRRSLRPPTTARANPRPAAPPAR